MQIFISFYLLNKWRLHALKIKVMNLWDSGDSHFALFLSWNNFKLVQTLQSMEFPPESTDSFCRPGILQNHRKSVKIEPWASRVLLTEDFAHTSPWFPTHILLSDSRSSLVFTCSWFTYVLYSFSMISAPWQYFWVSLFARFCCLSVFRIRMELRFEGESLLGISVHKCPSLGCCGCCLLGWLLWTGWFFLSVFYPAQVLERDT